MKILFFYFILNFINGRDINIKEELTLIYN